MLEALVHAADWRTGVIAGVTLDRLALAAGVSTRTVTRIVTWARTTGVLARIEDPLSPEVLDADHGRAPAYVVTSPALLTGPEEALPMTLGDPSRSLEGSSALRTRGLERSRAEPPAMTTPWPWFDRPQTPQERAAASDRVLDHLGVPHRHRGRGRAMLAKWWQQGACPAGLAYAVHHGPDDVDLSPITGRGDALRNARDPLAVLGHRLSPWDGRLTDLPPDVRGHNAATRLVDRAAFHARQEAAEDAPVRGPWRPTSSADVRAAARAACRTPSLGRSRRGRSHRDELARDRARTM